MKILPENNSIVTTNTGSKIATEHTKENLLTGFSFDVSTTVAGGIVDVGRLNGFYWVAGQTCKPEEVNVYQYNLDGTYTGWSALALDRHIDIHKLSVIDNALYIQSQS